MASTEEKPANGKPKQKAKPDKKPKCGIVMPISDMDGYPSGHWNDVLTILETVVKEADFEVDLVSNADEVTVIHQTIVQNLYENDIVICDVSGKNANVMFELGMRLAFDKPTIIIIDDKTDFSFDTGVIAHVLYPSDLRFPKMVDFQKTLKNKILATHKKASEDPNYSPFLKHFGRYKVTGLETQELSADKFIMESLSELTTEVRSLKLDSRRRLSSPSSRGSTGISDSVTSETKTGPYDITLLVEGTLSEIDDFIAETKMRYSLIVEITPRIEENTFLLTIEGSKNLSEIGLRVLVDMATIHGLKVIKTYR
jgi:hypothetical protein